MNVTTVLMDELMNGAIDIHCHIGPQPTEKKRFDAIDTVQLAEEAGMRAICIKCNFFPTGGFAYLAKKYTERINVFGYVPLNNYIGGLNPDAVNAAIRYGNGIAGEFAKIVTLPTVSAGDKALDASYFKWLKSVDIFRNGSIIPEVKEIFSIIKENNLILATGHSDPETTIKIIEEARASGIEKIVATHAEYKSIDSTIEQQKKMADLGAYIEHLWVMCTPYYQYRYNHFVTPERVAEAIKEVGAHRCVMGTDFGADPGMNPPEPEGLRMFIGAMMACGISKEEIEKMVKHNSALLLNLHDSEKEEDENEN